MKTRKHKLSNIMVFLNILNCIKLFHWNTRDYSKHKATDSLYTSLNALVDSYVEKLFGEKGRSKVHHTIHYSTLSDDDFMKEIHRFKTFLIHLQSPSTDLSNIRDEMLGEVNQFLYLWTLH
jgi:DNA-binding ferritin-like protein